MTTAPAARLASYERQYRDLARQLSQIGWIASGSLALRPERCGKSNCACRSDPARLHGPYWHFTTKVDGKTVNKRLAESEARLYEQWIANDRMARALLSEMKKVAAEAQALILAQEGQEPPRTTPHRRRTVSPQTRKAASRSSD